MPVTTAFHAFSSAIQAEWVSQMPTLFTCPFHYTPHPLSVQATREVQLYLATQLHLTEELNKGKMFGVLIVRHPHTQELGFLAAFSGNLAGNNHHDYFVPPVYDLLAPDGFFKQGEACISGINKHISMLEESEAYRHLQETCTLLRQQASQEITACKHYINLCKARRMAQRQEALNAAHVEALNRESQFQKAELKRLEHRWKEKIALADAEWDKMKHNILELKHRRKDESSRLQQRMFAAFTVRNALGEEKNLIELFKHSGRDLPPAGAGECAAPKLLQYAYLNQFTPLAMAEFWWGASPKTEVRHAGSFYPACQSKCKPILNFMLQGLQVEPNEQEQRKHAAHTPQIVWEDEWYVIVNKPAGMLSVPGNDGAPSVVTWAAQHYDNTIHPLIVHRLDMDTSGLLLLAKTKEAQKLMQQQFESRKVKKMYTAVLSRHPLQREGIIKLPLCPNIHERPLQMVDFEHGKPSVTRYKVVSQHSSQHAETAIVQLYPLTGRTHQLRVHCAHPSGLDAPIVGDNLYGSKCTRLYLHATHLEFTHSFTHRHIKVECPPSFPPVEALGH